MTRPGQVGDNTPTKQRRVLQASRELYGSQSGADSEASIARLTRERDEALAQQTATSEILLFFPMGVMPQPCGVLMSITVSN